MPEGVNAAADSLGPLMDAQVPAVVAVVVTTDPGPWLDEALSSLAAQDYEELSVLVLSTGEDDPEDAQFHGRAIVSRTRASIAPVQSQVDEGA